MIASPYGSKELQRKRKALVDAKKHEYVQNEASSQVKPVVAEDTVKTEETETETKRLISEGSP